MYFFQFFVSSHAHYHKGPALAIICFVPLSPIFFDIDSKFGRVLVSQLGGTARLDHSRLSAVGRVLSHVDWPKGINTTPHTLRELKRRAKLDPMCKIKSPFNDEFDVLGCVCYRNFFVFQIVLLNNIVLH